jgi:hypothetical protein
MVNGKIKEDVVVENKSGEMDQFIKEYFKMTWQMVRVD